MFAVYYSNALQAIFPVRTDARSYMDTLLYAYPEDSDYDAERSLWSICEVNVNFTKIEG